MICKAVRGATSVSNDKKELIAEAVKELVVQLIQKNNIEEGQIISIQFTLTDDLHTLNPASALRQIGFDSVPLFCAKEPKIKGGLKKIIRVLITFNGKENEAVYPLYLNRATLLRPDLIKSP